MHHFWPDRCIQVVYILRYYLYRQKKSKLYIYIKCINKSLTYVCLGKKKKKEKELKTENMIDYRIERWFKFLFSSFLGFNFFRFL